MSLVRDVETGQAFALKKILCQDSERYKQSKLEAELMVRTTPTSASFLFFSTFFPSFSVFLSSSHRSGSSICPLLVSLSSCKKNAKNRNRHSPRLGLAQSKTALGGFCTDTRDSVVLVASRVPCLDPREGQDVFQRLYVSPYAQGEADTFR